MTEIKDTYKTVKKKGGILSLFTTEELVIDDNNSTIRSNGNSQLDLASKRMSDL